MLPQRVLTRSTSMTPAAMHSDPRTTAREPHLCRPYICNMSVLRNLRARLAYARSSSCYDAWWVAAITVIHTRPLLTACLTAVISRDTQPLQTKCHSRPTSLPTYGHIQELGCHPIQGEPVKRNQPTVKYVHRSYGRTYQPAACGPFSRTHTPVDLRSHTRSLYAVRTACLRPASASTVTPTAAASRPISTSTPTRTSAAHTLPEPSCFHFRAGLHRQQATCGRDSLAGTAWRAADGRFPECLVLLFDFCIRRLLSTYLPT